MRKKVGLSSRWIFSILAFLFLLSAPCLSFAAPITYLNFTDVQGTIATWTPNTDQSVGSIFGSLSSSHLDYTLNGVLTKDLPFISGIKLLGNGPNSIEINTNFADVQLLIGSITGVYPLIPGILGDMPIRIGFSNCVLSGISGTFSGYMNINLSIIPNTGGYNAYGGNLFLSQSQVPIPAGIWLLGSGLVGLMGIRRKKNQSKMEEV